jgi:glycosyltransferase involved in cell wall biosynthesis
MGMYFPTSYQSVLAYISFDIVPAPKGAATHIEAFTKALADAFGAIELVTAGTGLAPSPRIERWPGVFHTELPAAGVSLIDRVLCFRRFLAFWLSEQRPEVVQFRSTFEGVPLLKLNPRPRLIFEVNGLPSIELKYRYPRVADDRELIAKLIAQERACLCAADRIVTPSAVTARFLAASRGADASRIRVIPNGVWPRDRVAPGADGINLLYFGTLSSWQGVDLAVRALAEVQQHAPARMTVLGTGNTSKREMLAELAAKLGVAQDLDVLPPVDRLEVGAHLERSFAVVAPLAINDRNVRQGCCPLKILEGMAAGVPVITSDLPVTREIGQHDVHLLLVKPGSVDQVARAVLRLDADRDLWRRISEAGRAHALANYTWQRAGGALAELYEELSVSRPITA